MNLHNNDIVLSIIIPAYNAEHSIAIVIENISKLIENANISYEIISVNDGSSDETLTILQKLEDKFNLSYISYSQNKGKGYAIRAGVLRSRGQFVLYTDGDLDISTNFILKYLKYLESYDIAIASKKHPDSKIQNAQSRTFLSNLFNFSVRALTNLSIKDTQVGFKIGRGDIVRKIFNNMVIDRFSFDVEFLVIATLLKLKIIELPIEMSVKRHFNFTDIIRMLFDLLRISLNYKFTCRYQKTS
jgi:glycosyltransferase involved in cell wall biosynthesis